MARLADASTQLDVDEAILDYLLYSATKCLVEDHISDLYAGCQWGSSRQADRPVQMVEGSNQLLAIPYDNSGLTQVQHS